MLADSAATPHGPKKVGMVWDSHAIGYKSPNLGVSPVGFGQNAEDAGRQLLRASITPEASPYRGSFQA